MNNDTISRQAAIAHLKKRLIETAINNTGVTALCDSIFADIADNRIEPWMNEVPSAEKTGRWLWADDVRCSRCGYKLLSTGLPSYCPNCEARMVEGKQ